jgi:D-sedoheptulose 7-phosphate isomerase
MSSVLNPSANYLGRLVRVLDALDRPALDRGVATVAAAWQRGAQIITLGNGGSAMTALHYITDWAKSIPAATGRSFNGRSLVDNMGLVMAYGNDISFADIFAEQLKNVMRPGDLVIAISGSGNSENVIRAVDHANTHGGETLGLCGFDGGRLREKAQHAIWVPVKDMQLSEDAHAIFGHIVMQALCGMLEHDRAERNVQSA